jgi:SNF family Na+-dependent transporter
MIFSNTLVLNPRLLMKFKTVLRIKSVMGGINKGISRIENKMTSFLFLLICKRIINKANKENVNNGPLAPIDTIRKKERARNIIFMIFPFFKEN